MIYDEPRFCPGGDRYVLIEFGNEMNLELNFMAQGLASAIENNRTKGVIETAPCFASMLVHYDIDAITFADLKKEMTALIASLGPSEDIELDSRLFYFPTCYLEARSGCGIRPTTLCSRLHTPAMFASEPFGFAAASSRPSGVV